jgi:RNA polymerase sigma-70 factor (ECF subfamily)
MTTLAKRNMRHTIDAGGCTDCLACTLCSAAEDELTRLALSARDGNRHALNVFVRRTQADVWRTCRHLGPPDSADDLTQDVYLRMVKSLLGIARHVAIDAVRSRQRRARFVTDLTDASMAEAPDHSADFHDILLTLDHDQRSAFLLTQFIGLTYEETAMVCECAIGTVRSRVARARERLVAAMQHPSWAADFPR